MLSILDIAISLAGGALELAIAFTLVRRHLWRKGFFLFLVYICYSIANVAVLIISSHLANRRSYFTIYAGMQALYTLVGLLAINESFRKSFHIYYLQRPWFSFLVPAVVLSILSISLWSSSKHVPIQAGPLTTVYITLDLASNYIFAGIFGVFGILVFFWRTKWQRRPFGVIVGFGIFGVVGMTADALRSDFGIKMDTVFSYGSAVAYVIACLVWLRAFRHLEDASENRPPSNVDPRELLELFERLTNLRKGSGKSKDADKSFAGMVNPHHALRLN